MDLKKLVYSDIRGNERDYKEYFKEDEEEFTYNNLPLGYPISVEINEDDDFKEYKCQLMGREEAEFEDYEGNTVTEKSFVVGTNEGDKFLVAFSELPSIVDEFVNENIEEIFDYDKFIKENYGDFDGNSFNFEGIKFLTPTRYGIELEGGWNGHLSLDGFRGTTDTSFDVPGKDYDDEFVYRGCDLGNKVLNTLKRNYDRLENHEFEYVRKCGTHIHFSQYGKKDPAWDKLTFLKTAAFLVSIEDIIFDVIPAYRVGTIDRLNGNIFSKHGGYSKSVYNRKDNFLKTIEEVKYNLLKNEMDKEITDRLLEKVKKTWYGTNDINLGSSYNATKYHGINLHSYFHRGSIELRHFEGNYKNTKYYMDLIDKIMYLIEEFSWEVIQALLDKIDSYKNTSTKSAALIYALGVSKDTQRKLLSRTDHTQLNIVKSHRLLNQVRNKITDEEVDTYMPLEFFGCEESDVTCFRGELGEKEEYEQHKHDVLDQIIKAKDNLKDTDFEDNRDEFTKYIGESAEVMW